MTGRFNTGLAVSLELTSGTWTDISGYVYNRSLPGVTITRGRPDETSQANPSQMTGQLNNRDGRFTSRNPTGPYYPNLTRNTPVRLSVPDSGTYLRFADDNTSFSRTADSASLQITGNIDVRIDCNLDNYQECVLISKWGVTAIAWALVLNGDGTVTFWWWDGTNFHHVTSTAPIPLGRVMVRCAFQPNSTGLITFLTAPTMASSETQLGAAISQSATSINAAAGQPVTVGYSDQFEFDAPGYFGLQGKVYEAAVYNSAGTLVADPQFFAQTAGATFFTDGQGNVWNMFGTSELSNRSYRYHGEMSSLPVSWDTSGHDIWVPFQASGILRRLSQGNSNVWSSLHRAIFNLNPPVRQAWMCEDGKAATQLASAIRGYPAMIVVGSPNLSTNNDFACAGALPTLAGSTWIGNVPAYSSNGSIVVRFLLEVPSGGDVNDSAVMVITTTGTNPDWLIFYTSAGGGSLALAELIGGVAVNSVGPLVPVNGGQYLVSAEITPSGGNVNYTMTLLQAGTSTAIPSNATNTVSSASVGIVTQVTVNGAWNGGGLLSGSVVGGIYVQDTYTAVTTMANPLAAWAGETAANRVARLCTENGISPRVYGFPARSAVMGGQAINTLLNLLQECEAADNGMLYEPQQAFGVGYRTLASMISQTAALTLDYSLAQVGDQENSPVSLASIDDDQYTRNDVTVTRTSGQQSGSSYQYALNDGSPMSISPPPVGVGDYTNSVSVNVLSDSQLPDAAGWLVHTGTVLQERYPKITAGLHRPPIVAAGLGYSIQNVNIGDYVAISNPPAWLPPGTIRQLVAGVTETMTSYLYQVQWNAIPETPYETIILGDATYGRVNTSSCVLQGAATSGASALVVGTPVQFPAWTIAGGDVPFYAGIAGEQIQVTAVTNAVTGANFLTGQNTGFEGGLGNWAAISNCTVADTAAQAHSGTHSMAMTSLAAGNMSAADDTDLMPVTSGQAVTCSAWFRAATVARSCQVQVDFFSAPGVYVTTVNGQVVTDSTSGWTQGTDNGLIVAPITGFACAKAAVLSAGAASEVHYADDVILANAATQTQTLSVSRSANGVVKAQASGAAVSLWYPPILALT